MTDNEFDENEIPLSYGQERRLQRDCASQGSRSPHNITAVFDIRGPVNVKYLEAACWDVVHRHAALRTVFFTNGVHFRAKRLNAEGLHSDRLFTIVQLDSQAAPAVLERLSREEAISLFDLAHDVKLRVMLIMLPHHRFRLTVTVEHLVCDGESFSILLRDLSLAYRDRVKATGERSWDDLSIGISWGENEQEIAATGKLEQDINFWRMVLDPLEPLPETRFPGMRDPMTTPVTAARSVGVIPQHVVENLRTTCALQSASLYSGFLASVALSIFSHTGRVVIGIISPISVRPQGWESSVDWISTSAILRFKIDPLASVSQVVALAQNAVLDAIDHYVPTPLLLNHLQPSREDLRRWTPYVALHVETTPDTSRLLLVDAEVTEVKHGISPALRPGVSIGIDVSSVSTSIFAQYEKEVWRTPDANAFIGSLCAAAELLTSDLSCAEAADMLRRMHGEP
ncbi:condensation domain-containing protein [Streptomyces sp. NPDC001127]|uniref:condensation domain-containing protein n=1 Tax=Streptomyces sp. NPDC001127 TaxID=3154377 RepID=UPI00331B22B8